MTIPATTDHFLVQNIFQLQSGLPEDVVVNNFIFRNTSVGGPAESTPAQQRAADAVRNFYNTAAPSLPNKTANAATLIGLMSKEVVGWQQKVYDLGSPPGGRAPTIFTRTGADFPSRSGTDPLPAEVAAVLTLQTRIIGRRGRGRLFLGPFSSASLSPVGAQINPSLLFRILAQAAVLMTGNGQGMEWRVYSPTRNAMEAVVGGWADNAWDIQRRRGTKPTSRDGWGTQVGTVAAPA